MKKNICVLAYSGGMDSTISIQWIKENYGMDVITLTAGLSSDLDEEKLKKRALKAGAIEALVLDLREEFISNYAYKSLLAMARYEDKYPLATALARPLVAKKLVEVAKSRDAKAVAHGCTGKGNDQVRFEVAIKALSSAVDELEIVAPARVWDMTRDEEKKYAKKAHFELDSVGLDRRVYSIDANLWGVAVEGEDLEDTMNPPKEDAFVTTTSPSSSKQTKDEVEIGFEKGIPTTLNKRPLKGHLLVEALNKLGAEHGIGRLDMVENRLVGIKSREVYEAPCATILISALGGLEELVLSKNQLRVKRSLSMAYADLVYDGLWFSELRLNLDAFFASLHRFTTGSVTLSLFKGLATVIKRNSKYSLYDYSLATYSTSDTFKHSSAEGFIDLYSLTPCIQYNKQTSKTENE